MQNVIDNDAHENDTSHCEGLQGIVASSLRTTMASALFVCWKIHLEACGGDLRCRFGAACLELKIKLLKHLEKCWLVCELRQNISMIFRTKHFVKGGIVVSKAFLHPYVAD